MIFPTFEFVIFFILFITLWSFAKTEVKRVLCITAFNIVFYGFYSPLMLGYLAAWAGLLYLFSKYPRKAIGVIIFSIYQIFFWKMIDAKIWSLPSGIVAPLGVSFFTFQGLTYILGVLKKPAHLAQYHIEEPWSFLKVFSFVGFFPTVISGPILRAKNWEENLKSPITITNEILHRAFIFIAIGCLYKLCFSSIFHDYVSEAYSNPKDESSLILLNGMYAYSLEIFHDFAGYSMMSIGIGLLMGFNIPINFNAPYFAKDIKEFWQRWHISLSSWLRDYIYFFLGGSKVDKSRQLINVALVMTLSGIWHGLSLNYLIWGLMHTVAIVFYHSRAKHFNINKYLCVFLLFNYVSLAWIFFRSPSATIAFDYIQQMCSFNFSTKDFNFFLYSLIVLCLVFQYYESTVISYLEKATIIYKNIFTFCLFWIVIIVSILALSPAGMPPFIYFSY
jgi:alginate O-acetyltransferase complex protein AlgI